VLRLTCDTNILISALNFPGNPRRILNMAEAGSVRLVISDAIYIEVASVLRRKKFGWPEGEIERALREISRFAEHVEPAQTVTIIEDDLADNRILECAAAGQSDYLVSGDKHLLKLGQYMQIPVIKPADFLMLPEVQSIIR
jgi:putative PIN family toxin of toxin-antitoxin system